jgi:hypothetical protein
MKLAIRSDGMSGRGAHVDLGGHDISDGLEGLTLTMGIDNLTRADLRVVVTDIEVDAKVLAWLEARVAAPETAL